MKNAVIFGVSGLELTPTEKSFFTETKPFGFILFARNIDTPIQVQKLCRDLRECVEDETTPIFLDQEGGRVRRLRPPYWHKTYALGLFGALYEQAPRQALELLNLQIDLQSSQLNKLGIDANCSPSLDRYYDFADKIIGDRSFSSRNEIITILGEVAIERFLQNGIYPVVKHIPGHGRALADSHLELPIVQESFEQLSQTDFVPFKNLHNAPLGMTAHILFEQIDSENCATMSQRIISQIIRSELDFDGLLLTDDLSMKALTGHFDQRAKKCLEAGCDIVLHCNGDMGEMLQVAKGVTTMTKESQRRWATARQKVKKLKMQLSHSEEETYFEKLRQAFGE